MACWKRLLCGSVMAIGLMVALGRDAKADYLYGYPCSTEISRYGSASSAYTTIQVFLYSGGGCTGNYLGYASIYSTADCTSAASCPAYNNALEKFSDVVFSGFLSELDLAAWNWRSVNLTVYAGAVQSLSVYLN